MAFALAVKLLDIEEETCDYDIKDIPTFVHMKSHVQNIDKNKINNIWTKSIPSELTDTLEVRIGNFIQSLPVHYVEKEWMTPEKIKMYENKI